MSFLRYFFSRFLRPYIYFILIINASLAWPVYSTLISLGNPQKEKGGLLWTEIYRFFLQGYSSHFGLALSVTCGTMLLFTFFYIWLRYKQDTVVERHLIRSMISGSILGLINLFPTFFIYHFFLGERSLKTLLFYMLIGPLLSLGVVGPYALLAGSFLGLVNGTLAMLVTKHEKNINAQKEKNQLI